MEPLNQRRLSDISFVIDKDLNVKDGNRSFLRLVHKTDFNVNIAYILEDSDVKNFKYFLANFDDSFNRRRFLANIKPFENSISCILTITKEGDLFRVIIEELSYSRQLLDKALLESREFTALMQNFDAYYFTYDGKKFILKNTKDLISISEGGIAAFKESFAQIFKINLTHNDTEAQYNSMFADIEQFVSNKYYNFLQKDKKLVTVHTLRTSTRDSSLIVGSVSLNKKNDAIANIYNESKDGLTGLYNKKAITEMAIKKINEDKSPCSLIIVDADNFKDCNDSYGHIFGDRVLVAISSCISDAIKGMGIAGRIGGDEFLIILDRTEEEDIRNVTRNIRTGIQWSITNVEPGSIVTCSMGIARFPLHAKNYNELFELADKCLYIAKYRGRNCYIIYKPELHDKILIENQQAESRGTSGKSVMENVEAQYAIFEQIAYASKDKPETLKKVLDMMLAYFKISKISIYDKNLAPVLIAGADDKDMRAKALASPEEYFSFFNGYDFLHLDNTNVLDSLNHERYFMYKDHDISSTVEVLCKKDDEIKLLICYDVYKPAKAFSKEKLTLAILVAKRLAELF